MEKIVIVGPSSQGLAVQVAKLLNAKKFSTETKVFPDGECYLRIELKEEAIIKGKDVIIIHTTGASAAANQNQRFIELIMLISAVKRMEAAKIRVVVPYFAYSRQDKVFRPGESILAEELCRLIQAAGATEFYSVDLHNPDILKVFTIPAYSLDPMHALAEEAKKMNIPNPIVVCPDKGAYERSRDFAKYLGEGIQVEQMQKKRDVVTGEIKMEGAANVNGKDVIIADDIIATGGTMALAIDLSKKNGAKSVYAFGTHPLLIKNAVVTLLNAGTDKIIGTDTLDSSAMTVSMAKVIADGILSHP